jgi:hypothetical protein
MATGAAAYKQLQVPQDNINQGLQYWGGIAAKQGAEARARNEKRRLAEDAAKQKAYSAADLPDDAFKTKVTGFDTRDDIVRNFASTAIDGYVNLGEEARAAYDRGDYKSYRSTLDKQQKLLSQFENLTNNEEHLAKINQEYVKLELEGKISPVDKEWRQLMQSLANHNFEYKLDDNQNPYIEALLKDDETGEERATKVKVSNLVSGNYRPYETVKITGKDGVINQWLADFGKRTFNKDTGNWQTTTQVWDERNQASLDAKIDSITGDKRAMSSLLYQATQGAVSKKGNVERYGADDGFTKEDYELVRNFLNDQVLAAYDETQGREYTGKLDTLAERRRANRASEAIRRAAQKKGRKLTKKEEELSIRKFDINQAVQNNDVEAFKSGDFTWEGKDYTATDALVSQGRLIVETTRGNRVSINLEERALNDLYNAFEGKKLGYDSVMAVDENPYRETREGIVSEVDDVLDEFYDEAGNVLVDDEQMIKAIRQAFGKTVSDSFSWDGNSLLVNGKEIRTDNRRILRETLTRALGGNQQRNTPRTTGGGGASRFNKPRN